MSELIVTVGPATQGEVLKNMSKEGPLIFRINGAHVDRQSAEHEILRVRNEVPEARIMIDLPGNKIRTAAFSRPIKLAQGKTLELYSHQFNFAHLPQYLAVGDIILANDSKYRLEVVEVDANKIKILSHSNGELGGNKGFHLAGLSESLPFLFQRDVDLIQLAQKMELDFISLSFVRTAADIREARALLRPAPRLPAIIAKVETKMALQNLSGILDEVELLNIDRGDLSADIGMIQLPFAVKEVVAQARMRHKKIFLATQFLKFMENYPIPLLSEIMGLHQIFELGVQGIQLSEETAVGAYPLECVKLFFQMQNEFERRLSNRASSTQDFSPLNF